MIINIPNIIIWLFFAPALLFCNDIKPWYLKLIFILIAPSTYIVMFFAALLIVPIFVDIDIPESDNTFKIEHKYKNALDISEETRSYIPECDTVSAVYHDFWLDYNVCEKFRMKKQLSHKEKNILSEQCSRSQQWTETDSTYSYRCVRDAEKEKSDGYDYFEVTINKNDSLLTVDYGEY